MSMQQDGRDYFQRLWAEEDARGEEAEMATEGDHRLAGKMDPDVLAQALVSWPASQWVAALMGAMSDLDVAMISKAISDELSEGGGY